MSGPVREIDTGTLVGSLGGWTSAGPLHLDLQRALLRAIRRGDLPPGTRLPPERVLAIALSVSRGTVVTAYSALREQGWLAARQGSGTWVRLDAPRPLALVVDPGQAGMRARALSGRLIDVVPGTIDLSTGALFDLDGLPDSALAALDKADLLRDADLHGYQPKGSPRLRAQVAERYCAEGLPTGLEQVLITAGAQQALALTAAATVRPGDAVVVESPTYPGAIDALARAGARIVAVPAESTWASASALEQAVVRSGARLAYLMPALQNPIGHVMREHRRRELARLFDRLDCYLFCDDSLGLVADDRSLPAVASFSTRDNVVTASSLSKSVWGGMRVGWVRASEDLIARIARARAASDYGMSPITQAVAARILPLLDDVAASRRAVLRDRRAFMAGLLTAHLPAWTWTEPEGGLSLWVRLPVGSADAFEQHALRHLVAVSPGGVHCVDGGSDDHVRVSFAQAPGVLAEGVSRLAQAWQAHLAAVDRELRRSGA